MTLLDSSFMEFHACTQESQPPCMRPYVREKFENQCHVVSSVNQKLIGSESESNELASINRRFTRLESMSFSSISVHHYECKYTTFFSGSQVFTLKKWLIRLFSLYSARNQPPFGMNPASIPVAISICEK